MTKKLLSIVTICMLGSLSVAWCMNDNDPECSPRTEKFACFVDGINKEIRSGRSFKGQNLRKQMRKSGDFVDVPLSKKKIGCHCGGDCYLS